jgi:tRNA A37 threonylcarbamoyladenosine synthetase subunit TsaC/SUA5/YrdC
VNTAKQRPSTQEVAVWVRTAEVWSEIAGYTRLPLRIQDLAADLLRSELVTVLVPVQDVHTLPPWLPPAVRDGNVLLFGTVWTPLKSALAAFPRLYVSSANLTGRPPATTASEAAEMFGGDCLIVDGDAERDLQVAHRATSMVRVGLDGALELVRSGATDDVVTKRQIR